MLSATNRKGTLLIKVSEDQYKCLKENGLIFGFNEMTSLHSGLKLTSRKFPIVIVINIVDWAQNYMDERNRFIDLSGESL